MQQINLPEAATPDLTQLQSTMFAIEQACSSIQMHMNPAAAEATIMSLRQSPRPYQSCQFILENSQVANARFQAAAAIRDAAIREWAFLSAEYRRNLIVFCLCFVVKNANSVDSYVPAKVSAVAAQLMKRGWLDFTADEREGFFYEIKNAVHGSHGTDAQYMGINFLESLVSEFSPSTSTAMGLPAEFHHQCGYSLEQDYLKTFYCWAQDAALSVADEVIGSSASASAVKVCSTAVRLMFHILNWNFQNSTCAAYAAKNKLNLFASGVGRETVLIKKSECVLLHPGPTWQDVLISSGHIRWILGLYGTLRQKFASDSSWIDSPLAVSARQLIVQLCSLTGAIFPSGDGYMQDQHLVQMLSGIVQWIDPPDAIIAAINCGRSESEMLDGCRALLSIATVASPMLFDELLKSIRSFGAITLLSALTCEVIKANAANHNEEETWSSQAMDILVDTWNLLLESTDFTKNALSPEGKSAAATVFNMIVESELKVAADSAFDDGDDCDYFQASISSRDEKLTSYALIARAATTMTIPLLTRLFSERFASLQQGQGAADPTRTLEELYWLLLITAHVLADTGEGETPLVPEALQVQFLSVVEASQHPVVVLYCSIINFAEKSLDPEIRGAFFSPRLMEAVVLFLARWADTYLMPLEAGKGHKCSTHDENGLLHDTQLSRMALNFCGEHNQGKQVLDILIRVAVTTLVSYPGENDLMAVTCYQLLPSLVRRKNVCAHVVTLDSWRNLASAFTNERNFLSLTPPLHRSLAESLCRAAASIKNPEASNQYLRDVMGPVTAYLIEISVKSDAKVVALQPDAILWVSCLLERMRGAARATQPRTQKAMFDMGVIVMNPLLTLLEIYKNESSVIYMILKFVVDWVDGQVVFLEAKDTKVLVNFCMQLLQTYSSHNIGKISLSLSSSLLSEANTEKYKDLRALLQLLTNLCSKDLVDFSSSSDETEKVDISQVVYLGLHIITPLISLELLKYPKLCHDYFALLSHMLEVYPEKVAELNAEAFSHVVGTLDFGIFHQDIEVVSMCLNSLKALASYHYKERSAGKAGLGPQATGYEDPSGKLEKGLFCHFLRSLMKLLLFEDYSSDLVEAAADALFPIILCEQIEYQRLGHELIETQANPFLQSRLANALQCLTSSNQISSSLNRVNYRKFTKNLHSF